MHGTVRLMTTPSTCAQFAPGSAKFTIDPRPPGYRWLTLHPGGTIETEARWLAGVAPAAGPGRSG
jgi:3',5'-cyclic-AMP phosphodiesterase